MNRTQRLERIERIIEAAGHAMSISDLARLSDVPRWTLYKWSQNGFFKHGTALLGRNRQRSKTIAAVNWRVVEFRKSITVGGW